MTRLLVAALLGCLAVLSLASPASAHAADAPSATDYRTRLTDVSPRSDGVRVRAVENGARLEVRVDAPRTVVVLGYSGEPYLKITQDGVWTNQRSPATWVNATLDGRATPPASARVDTVAEPVWSRISDEPTARWHDHRTHWMSRTPPPSVAASPLTAHHLADWQVGLQVDGSPVTVAGRLDYLPPPSPWRWFVGIFAAFLAVLVCCLVGFARGRRSVVAGVLLIATAGALANGVGHAIDDGALGFAVARSLLFGQAYLLAVVVGAVVAAVVWVRGVPSALFALALAGACLTVVGGLADLPVFAHAVAPTPWSGTFTRWCTGAVIALGLGVAVAAILRLRALAQVSRISRSSATLGSKP